MTILQHRYQLPMMMAETATGGGAAVADPPEGRSMGGAFKEMSRTLKGGEPQPPEEKKVTPPPEQKTPPPEKKVEAKVEPPKKEAAAATKPLVPDSVFEGIQDPAKPGAAAVEQRGTKEGADAAGATAPSDFDFTEHKKALSTKARESFELVESRYKSKLETVEREAKEARDRAAALENDLKGIGMGKDDVERLKKEHGELYHSVELLGLERSPKFQEKYVKGRASIIDRAAAKLANAGGNAQAFKDALQLEGPAKYQALSEAMGDAPTFIQNQIAADVTNIEALDEERSTALQDARASLQKWGKESMEQEAARQREVVESQTKRFEERLPVLAKDMIFARRIPEEAEGAKEWNERVDRIRERGKHLLFEAKNFDDFADTAMKGAAYDDMQALFVHLRRENQTLREQIGALSASEPGSSSRAGGGDGGSGGDDGKPKTFAERVRAGMSVEAA